MSRRLRRLMAWLHDFNEAGQLTPQEWRETFSRMWYLFWILILLGASATVITRDQTGLYAPVAAFSTAVLAMSNRVGLGNGVIRDRHLTAVILFGTAAAAGLWLLDEIRAEEGNLSRLYEDVQLWVAFGMLGVIMGTAARLTSKRLWVVWLVMGAVAAGWAIWAFA